MISYKIAWKRSALHELEKLPLEAVSRITKAVGRLSINPYPRGGKKLVGSERTHRIRVGKYRVVYDVLSDRLVVEIIRIKHQKDVYR